MVFITKSLTIFFPIEYIVHTQDFKKTVYILKIKGEGRGIVQWWNARPVYKVLRLILSTEKKKGGGETVSK